MELVRGNLIALVLKVRGKLIKRANKLQKKLQQGDNAGFAWYAVSCLPLLVLAASLATLVCDAVILVTSSLLALLGGAEVAGSGRGRRLAADALFVLGQVSGKELNRVLKTYFAQGRPEGSGKEGSLGMPSYHAQASFFAAAFLCGDGLGDGVGAGTGARAFWLGNSVWPAAAARTQMAYALAAGVSYSRMALDMHSFPQIAVGAGVGCLFASLLVRATTHALALVTT